MTTERRGLFVLKTSPDGTKCAAECPQFVRGPHAKHWCRRFGGDVPGAERHADCIAAESAAREAEVDALRRGMSDALAIADTYAKRMQETRGYGHENSRGAWAVRRRIEDAIKRIRGGGS